MNDEIKIKVTRRVPKAVSKKAVKSIEEKVKKSSPKKKASKESKKDLLGRDDEDEKKEINLDDLNSEELDDESKRALIRARTATAEKQQRLNDIAEGKLVGRKDIIEFIKPFVFGSVEILDLMPDHLTPLVYKQSQKKIRDTLVKHVDKMKLKFINLLMEFDDE